MKQYRYAREGDINGPPVTAKDLRHEIEAFDLQSAAEAAAEKGDREAVEWPTEQTIWIFDPDSGEVVEYTVYMEPVPTYRATRS
jgi:hypothetical protein